MPQRDPNLPHQLVILFDREQPNRTRVSCNCLGTVMPGKKGGKVRYEYMEEVPKDATDSIRIYNDPDNHAVPETFRTPLSTGTEKRTPLRLVT